MSTLAIGTTANGLAVWIMAAMPNEQKEALAVVVAGQLLLLVNELVRMYRESRRRRWEVEDRERREDRDRRDRLPPPPAPPAQP